MPPIVAFVVGVLGTELIQFGSWLTVAKDRSLQLYFAGTVGHFVVLAGAGLMFCCAWEMDGLTTLVKYVPDAIKGDWIASGVPYTPQVGIIAGGLLAFRGDKLISAFRARFATAPTPESTPST